MPRPGGRGGPHSDWRLFRRVAGHARPLAVPVVALLLLDLLSAPLALMAPLPMQVAVDCFVHGHPLPGYLRLWLPPSPPPAMLLGAICLLVLAIAVAGQLQGLGDTLLTEYTGEMIVLRLRERLVRQAQRLSILRHITKGSADTLYRIQTDAPALKQLLIDGLIPMVTSAVTLVSMLAVILRLDRTLGLVALVVTPVLFALTFLSRRTLRPQSKEAKRMESGALAIVQEVLSALRVVKLFGQEERETQRFTAASMKAVRARLRAAFNESLLALAINLTVACGTAAVLYVGLRDVQAGVLTLGQFLLAVSYVSQLYSPLKTVSRKTAGMQAQMASLERVFEYLDELPEVPDPAHPRPVDRARGEVEFRGVSFSYDSERSALQNASFVVPVGARVAVSGHTGAGKTTLIHLLARFYDPQEGQVLLDGVDVREYRLADLRRQYSFVFQDSVLFATTLAENIAYARPEATRGEIEEAARAASIHDFIAALPNGYDTRVGEGGMSLSGGERQRLAMARAFLRDAPILVLDEPTSSLDTRTEAAIVEVVERLMCGRTTFIISHRREALAACSLHLTLREGTIAVQATGGDPTDRPDQSVAVLTPTAAETAGAGRSPGRGTPG
jgi:ATP-binding cassette subfamily B protein